MKNNSRLDWVKNSLDIKVYLENGLEISDIKWNEPFILKAGVDQCLKQWQQADYLKSKFDADVSVHKCQEASLRFNGGRNFEFEVMKWSRFIDLIFDGPSDLFYYLRSIGQNPRKERSCVVKSFKQLSNDVRLPRVFASRLSSEYSSDITLTCAAQLQNYFSSVLRVASPGLQMWTHFDIMDNVLIQTVGQKYAVLFPPDQASNLYLDTKANTSSSPVTQIYAPYQDPMGSTLLDKDDFSAEYPLFYKNATQTALVALLEPGDYLYIPALWFHNLTASRDEPSISVNLFWRRLEADQYDKKDLYGNKDLLKAQQAQLHIDKACELLDSIDGQALDFRKFYTQRFVRILNDTLVSYDK